jgi:predicted NBD/HSP70 family sugar kinase
VSKPADPNREIFDAAGRGIRHRGLRRANERAVLTVVGFNAGVSNAEISRLTGLAPQTVSAILVDLENTGLIERGEVLRGRRGQPATPIQLSARGGFSIGIELSWTYSEAVLINMHAEVISHCRLDYPYPDARTIVAQIAEAVEDIKVTLPPDDRARLLDLGIALPGRLGHYSAPDEQRQLWHDLDIHPALEAATGLEVRVFNDGNAGSWAEMIALYRERPRNVIYFLLSHFIAAGIITDGALWEGPTGHAANLGTMLVPTPGGTVPAHEIASAFTLNRRLGTAADDAERERIIAQWLKDSAQALAHVTFNAMTVIDAPLVIIDTVLEPDITQQLKDRFETAFAALPDGDFVRPRIIAGTYGRRAPAIGAAELALFRRYF